MIVTPQNREMYEEDIDGVELKLKMDDTAYFVDALITNLYKFPRESFIRELVSNAYDASVNIDPDAPVDIHVHYNEDLGKNVFEVTDYGLSMTTKEMYQIYNTLGESTAKGDVLKIGAFGIGSKSPLAYTGFFFITTRSKKDGLKSSWLFSKYKDALPKLSLLGSSPLTSEDKEGTTVTVPLLENENLEDFKKIVLRVTAYFPNVVYNFTYKGCSPELVNKYALISTENLILRINGFENSSSLVEAYDFLYEPHIVCNNVWYPVDMYQINANYLGAGFAYKGDLNKINLIKSREELLYSPNTKDELYRVIKKSENEFYNKFYKPYRNVDCSNYAQYFSSSNDKILEIPVGKLKGKITLLPKNLSINKTIAGLKPRDFLLDELYDISCYMDGKRTNSRYYNRSTLYKKLPKDVISKKILPHRIYLLRGVEKGIYKHTGLTIPEFLKLKPFLFQDITIKDFSSLPDVTVKKNTAKEYMCLAGYWIHESQHLFYIPSKIEATTLKRCLIKTSGQYFDTTYEVANRVIVIKDPKKANGIRPLSYDVDKVVFLKAIAYHLYCGNKWYSSVEFIATILNSFRSDVDNFQSDPLPSTNAYYKEWLDFKKAFTYLEKAVGEVMTEVKMNTNIFEYTKTIDFFLHIMKFLTKNKPNQKKLLIFNKNFIINFKKIQSWLVYDN